MVREEEDIKHSADCTIHRIPINAGVQSASCDDNLKRSLEVLHRCQRGNLHSKNIQAFAISEVILYRKTVLFKLLVVRISNFSLYIT